MEGIPQEPQVIIAESIADFLADCGYAYVEDEQIHDFAEALSAFFRHRDTPTYPEAAIAYVRRLSGPFPLPG